MKVKLAQSPTRILRRSVVVGLACVAAGCGRREVIGMNYRLRVAANIDGQTTEGASVIHLGWRSNSLLAGFDSVSAYDTFVDGEAPILATSSGPIFALINHPDVISGFRAIDGQIVLMSSLSEEKTHTSPAEMLRALERTEGAFPVPRESWPVLVRFQDLNAPRSAELIASPSVNGRRSPNEFITSVTVERTTEQVTRKISKMLPWLDGSSVALNGAAFPGNGTIGAQLTRRNFIMSEEKA